MLAASNGSLNPFVTSLAVIMDTRVRLVKEKAPSVRIDWTTPCFI
jgi:hypothetical protein